MARSSSDKVSWNKATNMVKGVQSTWDATAAMHVPLELGIFAEDTGMLSTGTIPLRAIVDQAPSLSSTMASAYYH